LSHTPRASSVISHTASSSSSNPVQIRVNRPSLPSSHSPAPSTPVTRSAMKTTRETGAELSVGKRRLEEAAEDAAKHEVSLASIVSDYLAGQHALCRNPMSTCAEFDLFLPHKCPDPRSRRDAPLNFTARHSRRSLCPPFGGPDGQKLNRKFIYSRFRPVKSFRAGGNDRDENVLTTCTFSSNKHWLYTGTVLGDVKLFNIQTGEEHTYQCHESIINNLQFGQDNLMITSTTWRLPYSKIWKIGEYFNEMMSFKDEEHLEFAKHAQDRVVGTCATGAATIWDLNTKKLVRTLTPTNSNMCLRNKATFDPTDDLILSDGVLWDARSPRQLHKFDKLNQTLSGVFHPNGLEIISNTEVWDIRTFHLLRTVPQLDQCEIVFNKTGDVIFGLSLEQELEDETKYETSFRTFDAGDYSMISTFETKKSVLSLALGFDDTHLAVIEQGQDIAVESAVRLYEVGRNRAEEDEDDDDEDNRTEENDSDDEDEYSVESDASGDDNMRSDGEDDDDIMEALNAISSDDLDDDDGDEEGGDDQDNDSWEDISVEEENL